MNNKRAEVSLEAHGQAAHPENPPPRSRDLPPRLADRVRGGAVLLAQSRRVLRGHPPPPLALAAGGPGTRLARLAGRRTPPLGAGAGDPPVAVAPGDGARGRYGRVGVLPDRKSTR